MITSNFAGSLVYTPQPMVLVVEAVDLGFLVGKSYPGLRQEMSEPNSSSAGRVDTPLGICRQSTHVFDCPGNGKMPGIFGR